MDPCPASIAELREAASPIFSMQDLKSLVWVGVHSEEDEPPTGGHNDDINIVTVWDPNTYGVWRSRHVDRHTHLEQRLHQAWQREIYSLDVTEGKLSDDRHTDAMLCSRTIYGSAQDQLVTKLRKEARAVVDQELDSCVRISRKIKEVQRLITTTSFEAR